MFAHNAVVTMISSFTLANQITLNVFIKYSHLPFIDIDKRASDGIQASPQTMNAIVSTGSHARSTSYSVSYCTKKTTNLPIENKGSYFTNLMYNLQEIIQS